jgi:hypothetical protein
MQSRLTVRAVLFATLAIGTVTSVEALDARDVGTFRVLGRGGQPTESLIRLTQVEQGWKMEGNTAGSWADVSCGAGCELVSSQPSDYQRFFPAELLGRIRPDCIHNKAFAFCRLSAAAAGKDDGYFFIALTQGTPIPLKLQREAPSP